VHEADRLVRRSDWAAGNRYLLTREVTDAGIGILGLVAADEQEVPEALLHPLERLPPAAN
jgi:hypothetical protein